MFRGLGVFRGLVLRGLGGLGVPNMTSGDPGP